MDNQVSLGEYSSQLRKIIKIVATAQREASCRAPEYACPLNEMQRKFILRQFRQLAATLTALRSLPPGPDGTPRIVSIAETYLQHGDNVVTREQVIPFLREEQHERTLHYSEIEQFISSLKLVALFPVVRASRNSSSREVLSLIATHSALFESFTLFDSVDSTDFASDVLEYEPHLYEDPSGVYAHLDQPTRKHYRQRVEDIAASTRLSGVSICEAAVALAKTRDCHMDPRMRLLNHVGYYLFDYRGISALYSRLHVKPRRLWSTRPEQRLLYFLCAYYGLTLLATLLVSLFLVRSDVSPIVAAFLVLATAIIASESISSVIRIHLIPFFFKPTMMPRIAFAAHIPRIYRTAIAVPTILLDQEHVQYLIQNLEKHYHATKEPHVCIGLLTDFPDASTQTPNAGQLDTLQICMAEIDRLNRRYAQTECVQPFFLLHRNAVYSSTEKRWMGWERKRGKVHQFVLHVLGERSPFSLAAGCTASLHEVQYVLVLDEDASLAPYAVQRLVAAHVHPLNHPHLSEDGRRVVSGYGILTSALMLGRSNDQERNPPNEDAVENTFRDTIYDVLGESVFFGKGLLNVSVYHSIMADRLPSDAILSHDVVESGLIRTGVVCDAVVEELIPAAHEVLDKRQHRWIRGDWQNLPFVLGSMARWPRLSGFARFVIAHNILHSLAPVALTFLLLVLCWRRLNGVWAVLAVAALPVLIGILRSYRKEQNGRWAEGAETLRTAFRLVLVLLVWEVASAFYKTFISVDAIVRVAIRSVNRKHLLEWRTSFTVERSLGRGLHLSSFRVSAICVALLMMSSAIFLSKHPVPLVMLLATWVLGSIFT
jgi:cyclic beta-1,2-glucan synthetase